MGLDSGETEKATLAGLGCGMGVEHLPGVCTVSSKFSSSVKEKSFRWSGRGGLNVCSLERAESFQVSSGSSRVKGCSPSRETQSSLSPRC